MEKTDITVPLTNLTLVEPLPISSSSVTDVLSEPENTGKKKNKKKKKKNLKKTAN